MHRFITKIVVAGLLILGEGAFASESNGRGDDRCETNGDAVQRSQPEFQNDIWPIWQASLAAAYTIRTEIDPACQTFAPVTVPVSNLQKHHPFNPRAPPVPAS